MSQSQPLGVPDPISLDGLDQMFTGEERPSADQAPAEQAVEQQLDTPQEESTTPQPPSGVKIHRELPSDLFTRDIENFDPQPAQPESSGVFNMVDSVGSFDYSQMRASSSRKSKPQPVPVVGRPPKINEITSVPTSSGPDSFQLQTPFVAEDDRVSRSDLVGLLEGFVKILRKDGDPSGKLNLAKAQKLMMQEEVEDIRVEDKTQELEEMRRLVIEAQETIIKLLTDRVEDRARIATLETELRLLPDLQEQADRAMAVAFKTEEFRSELHKVKFELERYRFASVRGHVERGPRFWLTRVRRWLLKAQGVTLRNYSDANRRIDR
ncbi:MAG: hypothetical protein K2X93_01665 [Candidatus Obscuribacterales bacterium]|nr:hypothetical protein [Candidatus Obscuribacterales bacterium]